MHMYVCLQNGNSEAMTTAAKSTMEGWQRSIGLLLQNSHGWFCKPTPCINIVPPTLYCIGTPWVVNKTAKPFPMHRWLIDIKPFLSIGIP